MLLIAFQVLDVEMEFARLRALKHQITNKSTLFDLVEMEFARLRALKQRFNIRSRKLICVEMEFARLRALKHNHNKDLPANGPP